MSGRVRFALSSMTAILLIAASVGAQAESHVRIVRLSYIDGQVQMEHATQGLDRAILNTPIVQGTHIVTRNDGLAELEFEDQSALRLAENSEIKFRQLSANDAGVKINEIEVVRGVVFFDVRSKSDDVYRAVADGTSFLVRRNTLARISAAQDQLQLAVLRGDLQLEGQPQLVSVKKNETLTVDPSQPSDYKLTHGTEALPVDAWNKEREAYSNAYAGTQGYGGPRSGYGLQDLNYYGDYFYAAGYGYVWQPYGFDSFMTGWNPYSNGAWMFCPGLGYTWASGCPWGWLPYHYGSWAFLGGGVGWAWVPGSFPGQWYANNFRSTPVIKTQPAGWQPASPPATPSGNSLAPTILVGKASGSPAYVPGGRIPPNFASVISGRSVGPTSLRNQLVGPNVRNEQAVNRSANVFVPDAHRNGQSSHVFVSPHSVSGVSGVSSARGGLGAVGYGGASSAGRGGAVSSAGHASSGGHGGTGK